MMIEESYRGLQIAVIIPCFNEERSIQEVVIDFKKNLPGSTIYVFDNNSTDDTIVRAKEAGATVSKVYSRGKGNVVRAMFADVEADVYVMCDGDATYDPSSVKKMIDTLLDHSCDMVIGARLIEPEDSRSAYRSGHIWGNKVLTKSVKKIFGGTFTDMLSGYRVFSRRYVKSFPAFSRGFEIETELMVHALELRMPYKEISSRYFSRPEGSHSKLSTFRDGLKISYKILRLYINQRPLTFFGLIAIGMAGASLILSIPIFDQYLKEGVVPRFPTAFLSASMMVSALLSLCCGLILEAITRSRQEMKRLFYLSIPYRYSKEHRSKE